MESSVYPEDIEGRILVTKHGNLTCINTYLPNGSAKSARDRNSKKIGWMIGDYGFQNSLIVKILL